MTNQVRIGSRVYYVDNGPTDTGTIVDIILDDRGPFIVKWDRQAESKDEPREFVILDQEIKITINRADENLDAFRGSQLVVIEY